MISIGENQVRSRISSVCERIDDDAVMDPGQATLGDATAYLEGIAAWVQERLAELRADVSRGPARPR